MAALDDALDSKDAEQRLPQLVILRVSTGDRFKNVPYIFVLGFQQAESI
jgi:hypothetical protein